MMNEYLTFYLRYVKKGKVSGNNLYGCCPFHDDKHPSFSVNLNTGQWKCHAGCGSGNVFTFAKRLRIGKDEVSRTLGLQIKGRLELEFIYDYLDEEGNTIFQELRYRCPNGKKRIYFKRPDGNAGWKWTLEGIERVVYDLPHLIEASERDCYVFLVEGPPKVEVLKEWGYIATCNPGGAGNWRDDYKDYFKGLDVIIVPDNDDAGYKWFRKIFKSLNEVVNSIKLIQLPDIDWREDIVDWIKKGHTKEEFWELVQKAIPVNKDNYYQFKPYHKIIFSLTKGWFKMYNYAFNILSSMKNRAVLHVYCFLCQKANNKTNTAMCKYEDISKHLTLNKRTIIKAISKLESLGLIEKKRRGNRNIYVICSR